MHKRCVISFALLLSFFIFVEGSFHSHEATGVSFDSESQHCFLCNIMGSVEVHCFDTGRACEFTNGDGYIIVIRKTETALSGQSYSYCIRAPPSRLLPEIAVT
jgi:hypothetical protein